MAVLILCQLMMQCKPWSLLTSSTVTVNITSWETYVFPGNSKHIGTYDITFQIWRPSPTVNDTGCYSLVGQNLFTSVRLNTMSSLVQLTPTPPANTIITAQSGDVVGYYTNSRQGQNDGIQLNIDEDYTQNIIWYLDPGSSPLVIQNNECPFPIGTRGVLRSSTNGAPMLRIGSTEVPCESPSSLTSLTMAIPSVLLTSTHLPFVSSGVISLPFTSTSTTQDIDSSYLENINLITTIPSIRVVETSISKKTVTITSSINISSTDMAKPSQAPNGTSGLTIILSSSIAGGVLILITSVCTIIILIRIKTKSKVLAKAKSEEMYDYVDMPSNKHDIIHKHVNGNENEAHEVNTRDDSNVNMASNAAYGVIGQVPSTNSNLYEDTVNMVANTAYTFVSKIVENDDESEPYYY